ncbi:hypothetical protein N7447_005065 [Penicillium robsamsonii]|uniref:uncharacterized protein n=1 Tax=Penicillium robsamsonii TaxID=1792511 RepID=UPI0025495580|nr:uncharacterized protein N7447_005065 [Penicillium robsamsonii]KAJ5822725.1 hypothetical protein N7447_005065 [Penicillium robsamsonii]
MESESHAGIAKKPPEESAFSIVQLNAFSQDLQYLTVLGVDQVSSLITDELIQSDQQSSEGIDCVGGVAVSILHDAISRQMQVPIRRMIHQEQMELLQTDVE